MQSISIAEAVQKLPDLIDAALRGEEVVITKDDLSIVKLIPTSQVKRYPAKAVRLLLDTHTFIWHITNNRKLSLKEQELINDRNNEVLPSIVSIWEMADQT